MDAAWIFAVARPWHYWLAVVLVATGVTLVLSIAAGYYRQVLVPLYQRRLAELEGQPTRRPSAMNAAQGRRGLEAASPRAA